MKISNVQDTFQAPCFVFFPHTEPKDPVMHVNFEEKLAEYNKEKAAFLEVMEVADLNDQVTLKFTLGSVIFDLINSAIAQRVFVMPESPKLLKRIEKQFLDYAQVADNEEIEIPDDWILFIDKLFANDSLFSQVVLHGEISSKDNNKKTLPTKGRVLGLMPKLNEAILKILPA